MASLIEILLSLVAIFILILYFLLPLIGRHFLTYHVRPVATPVDESDIAHPDVRGFFREVERDVAPLGFVVRQTMVIEATPGTRLFLHSLHNLRTADRCAAMATISAGALPEQRVVTRYYLVEFTRNLPNGREISTSNLATSTGQMTPPRADPWRVPCQGDLAVLFRLHEFHVRSHSPGLMIPQAPPAPPSHQSEAERIAQELQQDYESLAARGVLKLNPRTGVYHHTVRSAYLAVWPLLPPFAQVRRWLSARRATICLREAGCPASFTPVDYPRLMRERYGVAEPDWGPPVRARAIAEAEQAESERWASSICPLCRRRTAARRVYHGWVCWTCWTSFTLRRQLAYTCDAFLFATITSSTGLFLTHREPGFLDSPTDWLLYLFGFDSPIGFVRTWLWSILFAFKDGFGGWSPGKYLAGIRVVDRDTRQPIGLAHSFRRNLILIVPFAPLLVLLTLLAGPRLGDRWANTMVVWVRHAKRAPFSSNCLACEGCTYDLTGNVSGRCPECGRPVAARQLIALAGLGAKS